jgi:hypothetical protein
MAFNFEIIEYIQFLIRIIQKINFVFFFYFTFYMCFLSMKIFFPNLSNCIFQRI